MFLILRKPPTGPASGRPEDRLRGGFDGRTAIAFARVAPYIFSVGQPTMAINGLRNKRCGPGGGPPAPPPVPAGLANRPRLGVAAGGIWGRNRLDARSKGKTVARHDTT